MQAIKEKNQEKATLQTHSKTKDVASELEVNYSTLYRDIKYLGIELIKDKDKVSWISLEDKKKVLGLRNHIKETGRRAGFNPEKVSEKVIEENTTPESLELTTTESSSLTKESLELTTTESGGITNNDSEIYVEPEEPTSNINIQELVRNASKLKAREVAMPSLITRAIADNMSEEDLPEDLKEKVRLAREAANPKYTPKELARGILERYRKGLIG